MNEIQPWQDLSLALRQGERFEDCVGYDGIYSVSNHGRVKSETRYVGARLIKERILKQDMNKGQATVKLSLNGNAATKDVAALVADAFLRERAEDEVVSHLNKIKYDNRLTNLKILTYSESKELDYKIGVQQDWGISNNKRDYKEEFEKTNVVREGDEIQHIICQKCHHEKPATEYYLRENGDYKRRVCRDCLLIEEGVKDVGKSRERTEHAKNGYRYCSVCKVLKPLDQYGNSKNAYLGKSNNCKACVKVLNAKYRERRKAV